jgi:hypothetical protein
MSLISSGDAVPSRVVGVLRTLHHAGEHGLTLEQLRNLMHPSAVWSKGREGRPRPNSMVEESLEVCVDLGLVEASDEENGPYALREDAHLGDPPSYDGCIKELGRRVLGGKGRAQKEGGVNHYDQFTWVLAWYMDQPLDAQLADDHDQLREAFGDLADKEFKNVNDILFGQVMHWGEALGLLVRLELRGPGEGRESSGTRVLLVNPAPFLRRHLADFMRPGQIIEVDAWLTELAGRFHLFDTGRIRQRIRNDAGRNLSASLSLALVELEGENVLKLDKVPDAKAYNLHPEATGSERAVSDLTLLKGTAP